MTTVFASLSLVSLRRFVDWWAAELSQLISARTASSRGWDVMFLRREAGCDAFVTKPCLPEDLVAEIRKVLDQRPNPVNRKARRSGKYAKTIG